MGSSGHAGAEFLHCPAIEILVICTGNACRSPMAAALLRRRLAERGVEAAVQSAGTGAWDAGATDDAVAVMFEHGLDLASHESRQVTEDMVEAADLVLAMTRDHAAYVTLRWPDAESRTFLLGELVRLGRAVGPRVRDEPISRWTARVAASRPPGAVIGRAADEVADPIGAPVDVYRRTAADLDRWCTELAELLSPLGRLDA